MLYEILLFVFSFLFISYVWDIRNKKSKKIPPGPNGLPVIGNLLSLGKYPHVTFGELAKKFGSIFTVYFGNYPIVVLNDYEAIVEAMKRDEFQGRPDLLPIMARGEGEKIGLVMSEGKNWMEQRRFTMKCLRDFGYGKTSMEEIVNEEVSYLVESLKSKCSKGPIPFNKTFETYMLNCLWRIMTGSRISVDDPKFQEVLHTISQGVFETELTGLFYFMPWLAKLAPVWSGYQKYLDSIPPSKNLMQEIVKSHEESFSADHLRDFTDAYLQEIYNTKDSNSSFYKEKGLKTLIYVLLDLFFAGSETSSSTLAWACLYLTSNKEAMQKVQKEIDEVIGHSRRPALSDRPNMPYTEATMAEILRITSIAPGGFFHTALKDTTLRGYDIPKGTILMTNFHFVHHNEAHWPNAEKFYPGRFINSEGKYQKDEHLIPFGKGKRICLGENLAMTELFLFLTGILQSFNFSFEDGVQPSLEPKIGLTFIPKPFSLIVTERNQ